MQREEKQSAQEVQDEIFGRMSADQKVTLAAQFWHLAHDLAAQRNAYGTKRPALIPRRNHPRVQ